MSSNKAEIITEHNTLKIHDSIKLVREKVINEVMTKTYSELLLL